MASGLLPSFHHIGAGYPLFIWFFKLVGNELFTVVAAQQALSLCSVLLLFYVFRNNLFTATAAIIVGLLHVLSDNVIKYEVWISPDSLITSLNLIWCSLSFHAVQNKSMSSTIFAGVVGAFSIIVRSSSVFFIPLTLVLSAWFLVNKDKRIAIAGLIGFILPLLLTAAYNYQWSFGNKFSFLTYERMETTSVQQMVTGKTEDIVLTTTQKQAALKLIEQLPDSAELRQYYLSWDLNKLTTAVVNCRSGREAQITKNGMLFCCNGDMNARSCASLPENSAGTNITTHNEQLLNQYLRNHKTKFKTLKYFLAYHANLNLVYGQAYYSTIYHAFETTVADANPSIYTVVPEHRVPELKSYILSPINKRSAETFDISYHHLMNDPIFKLYDIVTNRLMKPIYRNYLWLFAFLASCILMVIRFFSEKNKKSYFGIFIISAMCIGGSLVFAVFSKPLPRYSFEMEFCYSLVTLVGVAVLLSPRKQIAENKS